MKVSELQGAALIGRWRSVKGMVPNDTHSLQPTKNTPLNHQPTGHKVGRSLSGRKSGSSTRARQWSLSHG
jgi:hypothetical protein